MPIGRYDTTKVGDPYMMRGLSIDKGRIDYEDIEQKCLHTWNESAGDTEDTKSPAMEESPLQLDDYFGAKATFCGAKSKVSN